MEKQLRIAKAWDSYAQAVLPKNAATTQRWECRRAFYAGAHILYNEIMSAMSSGQEVTEADLRVMYEIDDELDAFVQRVKDGTA